MIQDLLGELRLRGIKLRLTDGRLDVVAPNGALTARLKDELRERRDELIAMLRGATAGPAPAALVPRPAERHEPFPLTDIQHAYWVGRGSAVELGGVSTHIYFELEREGLDPDRLETSLRAVIARHDMLRAIILNDGRQRVLAEVPPYELCVADLRGLSPEKQEQEILRSREEMDHQVLRADRWPLFDIRASRIDDELLRLHVSLDTLILDGYSMYLLFQDWRRFYEDPAWSPDPLDVSYRDHVLAEAAEQEGSRYRAAERYWLDRLPGLPPPPALPLAVRPALVGRPEFGHRAGRLPAARWTAVKEFARQFGVTPSSVLLTAYADVLRTWSSEPDFTLDLTLFNRPQTHPQLAELIGDFTSVTLLAVTACPGEAFVERVRRLQGQFLRDLEHSEFSGVRVLRERARREGGGPGASMPVVFTSALVLGNGGEGPSEGIRFFGEERYGITQTPQVWLDHQVTEERGDLLFNWDAVEALFPAGLLDDMFAAYCASLDRLADEAGAWTGPEERSALPAWQRDERRAANDTDTYIPARTLGELVSARARARPDATAVVDEEGAHSYRDVLAAAGRLARRLVELGAARDTLIGVVLDKGVDQIVAVLGVALSGAAYLPLSPDWPAARRHQLLVRGEAGIVVTAPGHRDTLDWPEGVHLVTSADPEVTGAEATPPEVDVRPDDLAYVIFTSGSTGRPKGVMIDHRAAANTLQDMNERFSVGPDDRVLALSALSFDLSVYDVFGALAAGAAVVVPTRGREHDPSHWDDLVRRHGVTVWNSVPALMQVWTDACASAAAEGRGESVNASDLRLVLLSGDWIPVTLPDQVRAQHPGALVVSLGGATEASIWSVHHAIGDVPPEWSRIPYGKPLANQTLHVYDKHFAPCPVWTTGEICIGGAGVARGYWADPELSAAQFVEHPVTGERLYRTGDLGRYLPGGDIDFLGRVDFQVKLNGYRIELGEIEAALRSLPGVGGALAGVETNPATGRRQLVAHLLPGDREETPSSGARDDAAARAGAGVDVAAVRSAVGELLPDYMVPHHFLVIDAVPLSANGKVDRGALPVPWAELAPEEQVAPRDGLESRLMRMWTAALERDDFGVDDNFFELGGDSLHAVRILTMIRRDIGLDEDMEDDLGLLFEFPTIAELAERLSTGTGA
ncbi:amino acid adenylation domain-containing protein [Streptomyces iconiensis]|uniref:Phenyloxazoline synthase MbtB n=1 Tax=Streptomyces iconiensis TaxID=1384038 RepID=A0ABT6ZX98_9ACTN|nr:amino acid adenylation domain-containing protein [Streptomyces iconiensis]MDJ1133699.1 amino acid adenylation domain-containing protein [Streptomyces iconiensis]